MEDQARRFIWNLLTIANIGSNLFTKDGYDVDVNGTQFHITLRATLRGNRCFVTAEHWSMVVELLPNWTVDEIATLPEDVAAFERDLLLVELAA